MKVTLTNNGVNPIKIMQRNPGGEAVNELNSTPTEFTEVFIQPGESMEIDGWYKAIEMTPTTPYEDPNMYSAGGAQ